MAIEAKSGWLVALQQVVGELETGVIKVPSENNGVTVTASNLVLTGLSNSNTTDVVAADSVLTAVGKLQGKIKALPSTPTTSSLTLAGLSTSTGTAVVAADSVLVAIGKLQRQITNIPAPTTVPKGAAVANATDETDVVAQLNALIASLRAAGLINT